MGGYSMTSSSSGRLKLSATLYSFWVCRVSVLSVLTGWLLFWGTRQAQAVFFDLHAPHLALYHWGAFYVAVFVFWMLPTQLSARVMLQAAEGRFQEGYSTWYGILIAHLPWVLALGCLVSVVVGQYYAFDHIPEHPTGLD